MPLRTVEESKKVQGQFLSSGQGGGHIKNLYLRDNKKRNVLLVAEQDRQIDLKTLNAKLGTGRLFFGVQTIYNEGFDLILSSCNHTTNAKI